jgi:hypothetical protein
VLPKQYEAAFNHYHNLKRDYSGDKAWKHLAGSQEMMGVSMFMQEPPLAPGERDDYFRYFESAIVTYQSKCNASLYAVRATLFATEMLCSRGRQREAVRAASGVHPSR